MAEKLAEIYEALFEKEGRTAQMRLAMMTDIPQSIAQTIPDTNETFIKFSSAYEVITRTPCPIKFQELT